MALAKHLDRDGGFVEEAAVIYLHIARILPPKLDGLT